MVVIPVWQLWALILFWPDLLHNQFTSSYDRMIKSYSQRSRTSDFWGRTSKNLPFSSPQTTGFFQSTCPKLLSLMCQKVPFPVNSYYLLPVNLDVWSPSWLFCGGKAWHLFLKDVTHFCATSFYPFVLLLILLLKGFKNFLMLLPSTYDKNDSLQTFFLFYYQTVAKLMFIMHIKRVLWSYEKSFRLDCWKKSILLDDISNQPSQN